VQRGEEAFNSAAAAVLERLANGCQADVGSVKVLDDDPATRVTTDAVFTEYHPPHVFVARQRITGDPGIDPDVGMELRVELLKTGRGGTLLRIVQGPYEASEAGAHSTGWERELHRLETYLASHAVEGAAR
jgi:hypothetical protein